MNKADYNTKLQASLSKIALVYHIKTINMRLVSAVLDWLGIQPNNNQLIELKCQIDKAKIATVDDLHRWITLNHKYFMYHSH